MEVGDGLWWTLHTYQWPQHWSQCSVWRTCVRCYTFVLVSPTYLLHVPFIRSGEIRRNRWKFKYVLLIVAYICYWKCKTHCRSIYKEYNMSRRKVVVRACCPDKETKKALPLGTYIWDRGLSYLHQHSNNCCLAGVCVSCGVLSVCR